MNLSHSGPLTPDLVRLGSIVILGASAGVVVTMYSPFVALIGTIAFTILTISLYLSSQNRPAIKELARSEAKSGLVFYLFYLALFLSMTIPKSGKTVAGIPITIANLFILLTLGSWLIRLISSQNPTFTIHLSSSLPVFMVFGFVALLIGMINGNPYKYAVLDFVAFIGFIPLYFLVCSVVRTTAHIKKIVWTITVSCFLVSAYGMLQAKFGFERTAIPGITEQYGKIMYQGVGRWNIIEGGATKVYSTFQNGNIFGNHLATFIPFLAGILIGFPSSKKKLLFAGIFLLACYVLILTYSRGALLGTLGGIMMFALISKKIRLKAIIVMVLIFSVVLVFLQQYSDRPELVRYDFRRIVSDPDQFSAGRIQRVKQVLQGVANLPMTAQLFGIGFGGVLISPLGWRFEYVDNLFLTLLFKMGLVGVTMLVVVLVRLFYTLLNLRVRIPDLYLRGLVNGGIAGLGASLLHNTADTLWFFPPLSANFWFLAGITMAIAVIGSQKVASAEPAGVLPPQTKISRSR